MRACKVEANQHWKHFKGYIYEIICIAKRELDQQPMVVYRRVMSDRFGPDPIWTRPLVEFVGEVHETYFNEDGSVLVKFEERFTLVPPTIIHKDTQEEP